MISVTAVVGDDEECGVVALTREQLLHLTEKVDNFALHVTFTERGTGTTAEASTKAQLQDQPFKIKTKEGSVAWETGNTGASLLKLGNRGKLALENKEGGKGAEHVVFQP